MAANCASNSSMGCDFPSKAYRSAQVGPSGKRPLVFNPKFALDSSTGAFDVPCGVCTGCRLERSRQWAVRMMHEASLHEFNCFVTLTYNEQSIPASKSLDLSALQNFMKRIRAHAQYNYESKIRFFACGEYSPKNLLPHYHLILFNFDFLDKTLFSTKQNQKLYISPTLSQLWPYGFSTTAAVNYTTAAYCARYTMKKIGGPKAASHYYRRSSIDGNLYSVRPEFSVMSRRPGIGSDWIKRYKSDVFPSGFVVCDGKPQPVPRFYIDRLSEVEKQTLKRQSRRAALRFKPEKTNLRRFARASVRDARISTLKRNLGDEQ